jgi:hypothetical protein
LTSSETTKLLSIYTDVRDDPDAEARSSREGDAVCL